MHVCLLCAFIFSAIDSNDECARRRERSWSIKKKEIRDKPIKASHLLESYLNPITALCIILLLLLLLCIDFLILLIIPSWQ
jgi:hypothetical protein